MQHRLHVAQIHCHACCRRNVRIQLRSWCQMPCCAACQRRIRSQRVQRIHMLAVVLQRVRQCGCVVRVLLQHCAVGLDPVHVAPMVSGLGCQLSLPPRLHHLLHCCCCGVDGLHHGFDVRAHLGQ